MAQKQMSPKPYSSNSASQPHAGPLSKEEVVPLPMQTNAPLLISEDTKRQAAVHLGCCVEAGTVLPVWPLRTAARPAPAAELPAAVSPSAAGPLARPRQPGLMAQIPTTGAGVGHTLGHAITGDFSEGSNAEPARPDITYQEPQGTQMPQRQQPCFYEIKPFLECARNQDDTKLCEGFSEVLKVQTCRWIGPIKKFKLEKWKINSHSKLISYKNITDSEEIKNNHQLNLSGVIHSFLPSELKWKRPFLLCRIPLRWCGI
ncbi:uncharacterized protein LOC111554960 [Piliocolobus tephrosceles]|uniref:uncharacterized protein LOC111554960 n=1 Tax=Piliocolobus tephrosceles TaxID=591936 RepID=UPI000C2A3D2C|nr:uncharacterized protein LOC111554960 [Piliocolobus tephrosceles]